MSKNTTTPSGAGANTPKSEQPTPSQAASQAQPQETAEQLKARIKQLEAKLAEGPASFEERVKYYQRKQELIQQLQSLNETFDSITEQLTNVGKDTAAEMFTTENFKLALSVKHGYNDKEILIFRNPAIIGELLMFLLKKVEAKRNHIQFEIAE